MILITEALYKNNFIKNNWFDLNYICDDEYIILDISESKPQDIIEIVKNVFKKNPDKTKNTLPRYSYSSYVILVEDNTLRKSLADYINNTNKNKDNITRISDSVFLRIDPKYSSDIRGIFSNKTYRYNKSINYGISMLKSRVDNRFEIGIHKCDKNKNCAGVFPLIYLNNKLYAMLGLDKKISAYSDFGGGFDVRYIPDNHRGVDSYKNTILQKYQIANGSINEQIMSDHVQNIKIEYDSNYDESVSDLDTQYNTENKIGYGDINTAYTAFREFIEETVSNTKYNTEYNTGYNTEYNTENKIDYVIDIDTVFRKMFVDKQYIYLGGDSKYNYDTFIMIFTIEDINPNLRDNIINQIKKIDENSVKYLNTITRINRQKYQKKSSSFKRKNLNNRYDNPYKKSYYNKSHGKDVYTKPLDYESVYKMVDNIDRDDSDTNKIEYDISEYLSSDRGFQIIGNSEMSRIDMFPLKDILDMMSNIRYVDYINKINSQRDKKIREYADYHNNIYRAPFYDCLRTSFADALVKYNKILFNIILKFDLIKDSLL